MRCLNRLLCCCRTNKNALEGVCCNPEHALEWQAQEIQEYLSLCKNKEFSWIIPFGGNAFLTENGGPPSSDSDMITPVGLTNWHDEGITVSLFFHCVQPGDYQLVLRLQLPEGHSSKIRLSITTCTNRASQHHCRILENNEMYIEGSDVYRLTPCGKFHVSQEGYVKVSLCGIQRSGMVYAEISHAILILEKSSDFRVEQTQIKFVSDPDDFYFGRRGPSVHLNYVIPPSDMGTARNIEYFYNEVFVPSEQDVIGAYFCAIGFSGGYFGIQVNSATERRVLFSVWSEYETDNPDEIPWDYQVVLLKKGKKVHIGEFGNEGSGGQSFLQYPWKSDRVYKFLVQGKPMDSNNTLYSAWFSDNENNTGWVLIASFRKPKVSTWLHGLYSFSENFEPETGHVERSCIFRNQWIWDVQQNQWTEITKATFSADATASKGNRTDIAAGVIQNHRGTESGFYLRNCGFFSDNVEPGIHLHRNQSHEPPDVNFSLL